MYREEKVMFDQIARRKRKEERQERRLERHFSVFFAVLMKIIVLVIILGILLMAAVCFAHLRPKDAESELPVSKDGFYEIDSAEDFYLFWEEICAYDKCARGRLMKDICLNKISEDEGWKERKNLRVYKGVEVFAGVFDGNGHTVSGLYSDKGYGLAVKNKGEKQCFVLTASGWDFPESGQTAAIKREQAAYIPFLVRGDLYQLLVKEPHKDENRELQEVLGDEVISDLLMELIAAKEKNWDRLSLEAEVWEKSALLTLSDGEDKVTISIYSAWPEEADWREEEDFEGLWQECAIILGEKDTESFEHSSWQIVTGQEGEENVFGSFVGFQTDKGRCGFFLQKDQRLYRVENRKNQTEPSEMYEILLQKLWDGRTPSLGISWKSEEIREAALAELNVSSRKKTGFGRGYGR